MTSSRRCVGCIGPGVDDEGALYAAFVGPMRVSIEGDRLTLHGPRGVITLDAVPHDNSAG